MKWYQSLYWRIAIGVIGCLALLLIVQGVLFVWLVGRLGAVPNQPPDRFAQTVAIAGTFPEQMIDDARTRLTAIRGREQQFGRGMFGRERGPFRPGQGPPPP